MIKKLIEEILEKEIKEMLGGEPKEITEKPSCLIGQKVIVRCRDAGVHYGTLVSYDGREAVLRDSRRMWYWTCKKGHTLSGCAIHGISDSSKIAGRLEAIILTETCEIIKCTKEASESIEGAEEHNAT